MGAFGIGGLASVTASSFLRKSDHGKLADKMQKFGLMSLAGAAVPFFGLSILASRGHFGKEAAQVAGKATLAIA